MLCKGGLNAAAAVKSGSAEDLTLSTVVGHHLQQTGPSTCTAWLTVLSLWSAEQKMKGKINITAWLTGSNAQ